MSSRILSRGGFIAGFYAQDFAIFGAERRGAPVVSCTRLSEEPVEERGYIDTPDLVVVMDATLLTEARDQVFHGVGPETLVIVNGSERNIPAGRLATSKALFIDLSAAARRVIGTPFISAASAAAAAKCIGLRPLEPLLEATRLELAEAGVPETFVESNLATARTIYRLTTVMPRKSAGKPLTPLSAAPEPIVELSWLPVTGPTILRSGSAELRQTGSWRMERPVVDLGKCKRCFVCYIYCPETAVRLDGENYPHIDYEHCKGCMICYTECPASAIRRATEGQNDTSDADGEHGRRVGCAA